MHTTLEYNTDFEIVCMDAVHEATYAFKDGTLDTGFQVLVPHLHQSDNLASLSEYKNVRVLAYTICTSSQSSMH
jgi:hypothetical protein